MDHSQGWGVRRSRPVGAQAPSFPLVPTRGSYIPSTGCLISQQNRPSVPQRLVGEPRVRALPL